VTSPGPSLRARLVAGKALRAAALAAGAAALAVLAGAPAAGPGPWSPAAIVQELRSFRELGSVLYIAAHPDDENTQLITYFSRGRYYRTAYMSLTRGDGGQNLLGPEFGERLGVIRTQELLAARGVDGGRQFFSRARDFGYSKDFNQTLTKWDREGVVADIVRVIRTFRPDVIVTRFPPYASGTHGHHTASAILALQAFRIAGDPGFMEGQLGSLAPWKPKRIVWNGYGANFGGPPEPDHGAIHLAIDGTDPVTGASFAALAARSRSMHRTQGFANFSVASAGTGPRVESFEPMDGAPAEKDLMDGIDTTWGRVPGGAEIGILAEEAIVRFDATDPAATVPALLDLEDRISRLAPDPVVDEKHRQLDHILQECLGLSVEAAVTTPEIVPGDTVRVADTATVGPGVPVTWLGTAFPGIVTAGGSPTPLSPGMPSARAANWVLPAGTPLSQPYWLRSEGTPGMFQVDDPSLIGRPWNPPALPVEDTFSVAGRTLVVRHEVVFAAAGTAKPSPARAPDIVAPVSLRFASAVQLFTPGSSRSISVEVTSARAGQAGTVSLEVPGDWAVSPQGRAFRLAAAGDKVGVAFTVTAPAAVGAATVTVRADIGDAHFGDERIAIHYDHIPPLLLQSPARLRAVCLDLSIRGRSVGYIPGAGDSSVESLGQMGYSVTTLTGADLVPGRLSQFDAVVIGVRAFNTRADLEAALPALFGYAEAGGTVVEQYNTPGGLRTTELAPYVLRLSRNLPKYRVTDEKSAVTLLEPEHPAFNVPNRITPADFEGWVQERGLDFASEWDEAHLVPLLACSDPGEAPLRGGLVVGRFGRGYFVYTGLSFFRQLPAGVPGAYRLFANLVSLGK
jgi:LmbE family N-acetylglucosaminyl deacetylase